MIPENVTVSLMFDVMYGFYVLQLIQSSVRLLREERLEAQKGGKAYSSFSYVLLAVSFLVKMIILSFIVTPLADAFLDPKLIMTLAPFLVILATVILLSVIEFLTMQVIVLIRTCVVYYMVRKHKKALEKSGE